MNRCGLFGIRHNGIAALETGYVWKKWWRRECESIFSVCSALSLFLCALFCIILYI